MCFMIYILHSENLYTFQTTTFDILKTVAKACEKVFRLNIGITHVISCNNICQVPRKLFEHEAARSSAQTSPE